MLDTSPLAPRAGPDPLPLDHAGGGWRAELHRAGARRRRLRGAPAGVFVRRDAGRREPLRPLRGRPPSPRVRRSHRCRAAGRRRALAPRPVRRHRRRRRALRPRRHRHEGRRRLHDGGGAGIPRRASGFLRLDRLSHHRRRGGSGRQRDRQAARLGKGEGRALRPLHPRRADEPRGSRRHDQDRAARLAHRPSRRARQAGPCRLSAARREPDRRDGPARRGIEGRTSRRRHRAFRRLEPRVHDARRRQSGHKRHPDGGAGDLQHPLQRPLVAAEPRGGTSRPAARGGWKRGALHGELRSDERCRLS